MVVAAIIGCSPNQDCRDATDYVGFYADNGGSGDNSEANAQSKMDIAGTAEMFQVNVAVHTGDAAGNVLTLRKNTADGNQTISVPSNTTGQYRDSTHTDSIAQGDLLCYKTTQSFLAHVSHKSLSLKFTGTSSAAILMTTRLSGTFSTASTSVYLPIGGARRGQNSPIGEGGFPTSEGRTIPQWTTRCGGTITRMGARVSANTSTNSITHVLRKNGGDGNNTFTISGSTTGYIEDTTHSDTITSGDVLNDKMTTGASTVSIAQQLLAVTFSPSGGIFDTFAGAGGLVQTSSGVTRYYSPWFGGNSPEATEANVQWKAALSFTWSNLRVDCTWNSGSVTHHSRIGGSDGSQTVTIGSSGVTEDTTHSDTVVADDLVNLDWVTSTTNMTMYAAMTKMAVSNSGTPGVPHTPLAVMGL
ncbi:hypothetical protein GC176_20540 [bacterium]|nr:hypothetical protein [bacterium]